MLPIALSERPRNPRADPGTRSASAAAAMSCSARDTQTSRRDTWVTGWAGGAGRARNVAPLRHSLSASQWMPATTLKLKSGWPRNVLRSVASVSASRSPAKEAAMSRAPPRDPSTATDSCSPGGNDPEIVAQVHVEERRHVEDLVAALRDRAAGAALHRDQVAVALPEGVVDLVEHGAEPTVGVVAEVDAERIEGMAEDARQREQADGPVREVETRRRQLRLDHAAQRRAGRRALGQMIAIVEGEEVEAIAREQPEPPVERVEIVEIEQRHRHGVAQLVLHLRRSGGGRRGPCRVPTARSCRRLER